MKTIRSKIFFGVLFLFAIIIALSVLGIIFTSKLAESSKGTIVDNYRTIDYAVNMLASVDEMYTTLIGLDKSSQGFSLKPEYYKFRENFEKYFELETANITEPGENQFVMDLRSSYDAFINSIIRGKSGPAQY